MEPPFVASVSSSKLIIIGDFNMVEQLEDRSQKLLSTTMGKKEVDAWNKLVMLMGVVYAFLLNEFQKIGPKKLHME